MPGRAGQRRLRRRCAIGCAEPGHGRQSLGSGAYENDGGFQRVVDWTQILSADRFQLQPGATVDEVTAAEAALATKLSAELRGLYLATDGVYDNQGEWFVVWPLSEVVSRNRDEWAIEDYRARQELLGFGDDGTGAPFCIRCDGRSGI